MSENIIKINGRKIGVSFPPYVIAEMSANHNGDINNAFAILEMSKRSGADAIKLQTYHPDTITMNIQTPEFIIEGGLWHGESLYDLYSRAFMPWDWHEPLFKHAEKIGITIFSSPFDKTAVDLLEDLNAPAYKIASFEAVDIPLIKYVAQTKKPMIISTGMANAEEIRDAVEAAKGFGCKEIALLHCVSGYPAPAKDYNLKTINHMQRMFDLVTGLSDHTLDNTTALVSIGFGASIIEKHVTLNRNAGGPDDSFSLEEKELKELCCKLQTAWACIGKVDYGRQSSEIGNVQFRRSLYVAKKLFSGDTIGKNDIKSIRPGYGLAPKFLDDIVGKKIKIDKLPGESLQAEDVANFHLTDKESKS